MKRRYPGMVIIITQNISTAPHFGTYHPHGDPPGSYPPHGDPPSTYHPHGDPHSDPPGTYPPHGDPPGTYRHSQMNGLTNERTHN